MDYFVFWIITGIAAGLLTRSMFPGERLGGAIGELMVGAVGAVAGGWVFLYFLSGQYGAWIGSSLGAGAVAFVALFVLRRFFTKAKVNAG